VDGRSRSARVWSLTPWTEYHFAVAAVNSAGEGRRAALPRGEVCSTPAAVPRRSPRHVCTDSRQPHQLVIVWEVYADLPALPVVVLTGAYGARPVLVSRASRLAREIRRRRVLCRYAIGVSARPRLPAGVRAGRWVPRQLSENDILSLGYRS